MVLVAETLNSCQAFAEGLLRTALLSQSLLVLITLLLAGLLLRRGRTDAAAVAALVGDGAADSRVQSLSGAAAHAADHSENSGRRGARQRPAGAHQGAPRRREADGARLLNGVLEISGPGIDDATQEKALQPFGRLESAQPGAGIGLALVQDICAWHGATLTLRRSPQLGGLRVTVRFRPPYRTAPPYDG
ncbi:ATP-binding protein [Candidatus Pantoea persica]|uniref:ATP-binding protein n=1 Tax=Candidatus Pantoea persica TaxID=2518128 RepID=UPI0035A871E3